MQIVKACHECECLLLPCGLVHGNPGNYGKQVAKASFVGNKEADIVTLQLPATDRNLNAAWKDRGLHDIPSLSGFNTV